jgi:hypothetical protein
MSATREHLIDGAKWAPVGGFLLTWFNGVNWPLWAAFLGFVYTLLLILDKCGLLAPLKALGVRATGPLRRLGRRQLKPGKPSA